MAMSTRKERGRIDELGVRDLVENMFAARSYSQQDIIAAVKEVTGEAISDSALSRAYGKWSSAQRRIEEASKRVQSLVEIILKNPQADLDSAGHKIIKEQVIKCLAAADLSNADTLEVANLFYKGLKLEADIAAQKAAAQQLDRPALYLECLKEFTDYLTRTAPSALTALGETFDGFIDQTKAKYAAAAH
jgi:hypothetical protein